MKLTTIECRLSRTRSHNFQSTQVQAGFTADLEEGDDPTAVYAELRELAKEQIKEAFRALTPATETAAAPANGAGRY